MFVNCGKESSMKKTGLNFILRCKSGWAGPPSRTDSLCSDTDVEINEMHVGMKVWQLASSEQITYVQDQTHVSKAIYKAFISHVRWLISYEMVGWHHWFSGYELGQTVSNGKGQGGLACCSPWGCKELDTTWWLNNNTTTHPMGRDTAGFRALDRESHFWGKIILMEGKLELSDYIYIFNSWVLMKWKEAFILLSFFLKKYLFIWLCWHMDLHCSAWAPSLWRIGSIVAVWGLSCLVVCGILVTWPGIVPESPALQGRFLTPGPSGKSLYCFHVKQTHKHISASSYLKILKLKVSTEMS